MKEPVWTEFLTPRDREVIKAAGYGANAGFGSRPVLIVIDVSRGFCGDAPLPILESIKTWKNSCGEDAWRALPHIRRLIDSAHSRGIPVIYSTGTARQDGWDMGGWRWKNARLESEHLTQSSRDPGSTYEILPEIAPTPSDLVILKQKPSAFFGTNLVSYLTLLGCDSVILVGTTTSGCVRATAIDAFSLNYRVAVVEEGCFDRSQVSHAVTLFDLHAKYADVVSAEEADHFLVACPEGMFDLPN